MKGILNMNLTEEQIYELLTLDVEVRTTITYSSGRGERESDECFEINEDYEQEYRDYLEAQGEELDSEALKILLDWDFNANCSYAEEQVDDIYKALGKGEEINVDVYFKLKEKIDTVDELIALIRTEKGV